MHGRHRAGGGARGARPLPASGADRPARGARGAGAGGDPPPARQRDRAHAGARDRAGGAGAAHRRRARGDRGSHGRLTRPSRGHGSVSALFITGTDTGVGKTFVACALATAFRQRGRRVAVMKPVETGVEGKPQDARALRAAAADPAPLGDICPYRLRAPLAPAVAARLEGVTIEVARLVALVARRRQDADVLLVEGAGGLLVPLDGQTTYA